MKNVLFFLSFVLFSGFISTINIQPHADFSQNKLPKIKPDSIPPDYFIPDSVFTQYNMELNSKDNPNMKVWISPSKEAKFLMVNDIRIGFANRTKAKSFFRKNLKTNSENALEIHPGIEIPGTKELHIFKESDEMARADRKNGIIVHYYFFLFLVDHIYIKVFVETSPGTSVQESSLFANAAARSVSMHLRK
jgi:hypothetical protein